jgi:hypothetical protein
MVLFEVRSSRETVLNGITYSAMCVHPRFIVVDQGRVGFSVLGSGPAKPLQLAFAQRISQRGIAIATAGWSRRKYRGPPRQDISSGEELHIPVVRGILTRYGSWVLLTTEQQRYLSTMCPTYHARHKVFNFISQ